MKKKFSFSICPEPKNLADILKDADFKVLDDNLIFGEESNIGKILDKLCKQNIQYAICPIKHAKRCNCNDKSQTIPF